MAGDKAVTGRLLDDDIDNVLTVEVARMAQERLLAIIVIFLEVLKFPVPPVIVTSRRCIRDRPPSEGPGGLPHVRLRIVAHTQAEQLQQLPPPVLIDRMGVVVAVIQPVDHGRILRQRDQQVAVAAHPLVAEHVDLADQLVPVVDLGLACREHMVPEEHHLLLQRPFGGQHGMKPRGHTHARRGDGLPESGQVPEELIPVNGFGFWMHQLLDRRLIACGHSGL